MVHALGIRRSIADPDDVSPPYLVDACPNDARPRLEIVRAIGARWTIAEVVALAKQRVGLDEYEARSWTGWQRHTTLARLALAALGLGVAQRGAQLPDPADASLVPISVAEVHRLLIRLRPDYPHPARFVLAWSRGRRHHQAVARACHIKRRRQQLAREGSL